MLVTRRYLSFSSTSSNRFTRLTISFIVDVFNEYSNSDFLTFLELGAFLARLIEMYSA